MWFKVDDTLHAHKKAMRAGVEAMGLWTLAGSWSASQLTDGWVPQYAIYQWGPRAEELAGRLVSAGFWMPGEHDGDAGWWFHEWEERNPTKDEVLKKRKDDALRRARWRAEQKARREAVKEQESQCESQSDGSQCDTECDSQDDSPWDSDRDALDQGFPFEGLEKSQRDTHRESQQGSAPPDPTRPDPTPLPTEEEKKSVGRGRRKETKTPIPDDWKPNENHARFASEQGLNLQLEAEQFRAHAEQDDVRHARWDAAFRHWLGNAVKFSRQRNGSRAAPRPDQNLANWQSLKPQRLQPVPAAMWELEGGTAS